MPSRRTRGWSSAPRRDGWAIKPRPGSADTGAVGVQDRDWYRQPPTRRPGFGADAAGVRILAVVLGALLLSGVALHVLRGRQPSFSGESRTILPDTKISLLPGLPSLTLHGSSLYYPNDQWSAYLAPEQTCPGGERTDLPLSEQAATMVCLVNFARQERGLEPLTIVALLDGSAMAKADRIVRCRAFAHDACKEAPDADARAAGYQGSWERTSTSPTAASEPHASPSTAGSTRPATAPTSSTPNGAPRESQSST